MAFGGEVKLKGESEYKRALNQINQSLKETASEMKLVTSAFDANDKSESAVSAKTEVLNQKLEQQREKLSILKAEYKAMASTYSESKQKHEALVNEYNSEKQKLEEIEKSLGKTSDEYKEQEKKVTDLAQEVEKSTKAQDDNEKSMSKMRIEINNAETACNKTAKEIDKLGDETKEAGEDAKKGAKEFSSWKLVLADLVASGIKTAVKGLGELGKAMVNVGKQSLDFYANFEQLEGGVKKIFGEDVAQDVIENSRNAFKTAGMNANEYMETVTGFSASLIQSLGGDTKQASELADMAIRSMADNANTYGSDLSSIQNAFQGFAKQNYTMLDNLKLGYGGTKTEMERLISDASQMVDVQEELGITVDGTDMSFANQVKAIQVIQRNMGIMGTTAKEASGTIQGATGSMKSAWENLVGGMADENANFQKLVEDFMGTLITEDGKGGIIGTIVPRIATVIQGIGTAMETLLPELMAMIVPVIETNLPLIVEAFGKISGSLMATLPEILPVFSNLMLQIVQTILSALPSVVTTGIQIIVSLINGIKDAIPQLIDMLPEVIEATVNTLINGLPDVIGAGMEILLAVIDGLVKALPRLIDYVPKIITTIVTVLINNLPKIIDTAVKILVSLIQGLSNTIPKLIAFVPKIIMSIVTTLVNNLPKIVQGGVQIMASLISGLGQMLGSLLMKAKEIGSTIINAVSQIPEQVISVGWNIVSGIWQGISDSLGWIKSMISGWVGNVVSFIKNLFGIHSPSKVMEDEVGVFLAQGIGVGFSDEMKNVSQEMAEAIPTDFDVKASLSGSAQQNTVDIVSAFKQALSEVKIVIDDEVAGTFVDRTVSRLIYE